MKPVLMVHEKSPLSILVGADQVEQAKRNGWYIVAADESPVNELKSEKVKGVKNGKNTRR